MKILFTICLLAGCLTAAAQVPATPAKVLTPAELRQKERRDKALEEDRKYREDIAKAQREYQAKQAEKERQRREKELKKQTKDAPPAVTSPAEPVEVETPKAPPAPKPEKPAKAPRPERQRDKPVVQPDSAATRPPASTKPARDRRERPADTATPPVDTRQAERDAIRQQEQTERDLIRQQEAAERKARKRADREKASQEVTAEAPALAPEAASVPGREFLPKGHLFAPILLDPLEAQTQVSVLPAFRTDNSNYRGTIVPFQFGLCKPFFRWTKFPGRASELSLDVASFTQFEVYYDDTRQTQKRQIINTDYKFSVIYNILLNNHAWRFRFYHLSSHLGDDYLFRNAIQAYTPNSVNYEIIDATYSKNITNTRIYGGIGIGLRKPEERKLLSAHGGFYYRDLRKTGMIRLVGGADVKVWQQTDFRPGIKAAVGLEVGRPANHVTFLLEGYSGFRPYSQYENQYVRWLGVGFYFNPI